MARAHRGVDAAAGKALTVGLARLAPVLRCVKRRRHLGVRSLLVVAAALLGCHTDSPPPLNLAEVGWKVRKGEAVWRSGPGAPELAGELLVATHPDGRALVQFTRSPLLL